MQWGDSDFRVPFFVEPEEIQRYTQSQTYLEFEWLDDRFAQPSSWNARGILVRGRRGFTLIELLVVIAIIGLLIALLLPALTMVMEAARRMRCQANLKQFGVAFKAYHATHDTYPPGFIFRIAGSGEVSIQNINAGFLHNGFSSMLPYFEQQSLANLYNYDQLWWDQSETVATTRIEVFMCPSSDDANFTEPEAGKLGNPRLVTFAPISYAMNKGVNDAWCIPFLREVLPKVVGVSLATFGFQGKTQYVPGDEKGVFDINSNTRDRDIIDGSSKTFLVGEAAAGSKWPMCTDGPTKPAQAVGGGQTQCGNPFVQPAIPGKAAIDPRTGQPFFVRMGWIVAGVLDTRSEDDVLLASNVATTIWPLNYSPVSSSHYDLSPSGVMGYFELVNCRSVYQAGTGTGIGDHNRPLNASRKQRVGGFHSSHPGGGNFLMGDGSVSFITDSIDIGIYRALSSTSGGEAVTFE